LKFLLEKKKVAFQEVDLAVMPKDQRDALYTTANARTIPMLFVNNKYIGDYEEVQALEEEERLDQVLAGQS